jgi:hypothetical protein
VTLSFTADRNAIPDPDFYAECMQKSFEDHLKLAVAVQESQEAKTPKTVKTRVKAPKKPVKTASKTVKKKKTNGVQKPLN